MPLPVTLRELDTNGKALDGKYEAGKFLHRVVAEIPCLRAQRPETFGAEDDTNQCGQRWFRQKKFVADVLRESGVSEEERAQDEVGEVWTCGLDLLPHYAGRYGTFNRRQWGWCWVF